MQLSNIPLCKAVLVIASCGLACQGITEQATAPKAATSGEICQALPFPEFFWNVCQVITATNLSAMIPGASIDSSKAQLSLWRPALEQAAIAALPHAPAQKLRSSLQLIAAKRQLTALGATSPLCMPTNNDSAATHSLHFSSACFAVSDVSRHLPVHSK